VTVVHPDASSLCSGSLVELDEAEAFATRCVRRLCVDVGVVVPAVSRTSAHLGNTSDPSESFDPVRSVVFVEMDDDVIAAFSFPG